MWWIEAIGYIGMIFLVSSFFFKDIITLRFLNMIGGVICMVYGGLTETYATVALNIICVSVNLLSFYIKPKNKLKNINQNN